MKKLFKIVTAILIASSMFSSIVVHAITGNVSLSHGGNLTPGSTISLYANYRLSKRGTIQVRFMSSDSSVIAIAGNGTKVSSEALVSGTLSVNATVRGYGSARITLVVDEVNAIDDPDDFGSIGSKEITLNVKKPEPKPVPQPTPQPTPPRSDSVAPPNQELKPPVGEKSSNQRLKTLEVENGKMTPAFNSEIDQYVVELPKKTTKAIIKATPQDSKANVVGATTLDVKEGKNTHAVVVTAEDGTQKTYQLVIQVEEDTTVSVNVENQKHGILSIFPEKLPEGFTVTEITLQDQKVKALKKGNEVLVYTINEKNEKNWMYVSEDQLSSFETFNLNQQQYILKPLPKTIPGLNKKWVKVLGKEILGYQYEDAALKRFVVLNIAHSKNEAALYQYDTEEKTLQVYANNTKTLQEKIATLENDNTRLKNKVNTQLFVLIGVGIVSVVGCISAVLYILKLRKSLR